MIEKKNYKCTKAEAFLSPIKGYYDDQHKPYDYQTIISCVFDWCGHADECKKESQNLKTHLKRRQSNYKKGVNKK